ncbi:hypothetical protein [Vibrio gallaecicus]|nr:hypothetical protein [Vibrio gallaecicus]MDN3613953.1 hypothetical protein [Vibrio gallaecicus]
MPASRMGNGVMSIKWVATSFPLAVWFIKVSGKTDLRFSISNYG